MKIIRLKNHITVILEDGTMITNTGCTDEMYNKVVENQENEDEILNLLVPEFAAKKEEFETKTEVIKNIQESKIVTYEDNKAYLKEISNLILPEELAIAIIEAEKAGDLDLLQSYKNFWTLCSLNPNAEARKNLFWFLKKYGMKISKSGLFVTYRNVNIKEEGTEIDNTLASYVSEQYLRVKTRLKKSPKNYYVGKGENDELRINLDSSKLEEVIGKLDELYFKLSDEQGESPTYTDAHSGRFKIKIGKVVTMPRSQCDENSSITCSRGLNM